ncbi:hypothetical protein SanaruYs_09610 [Chryseotalea sanaruensis]|uniref:Aromatic hydrocarbon degradation protein n=1 Tax=Chryseotalea sanaruensis TaxID=2482724 RepID=A0A401U778_9BACT|nr:hypothetical protein SanaruYs_09610 [Chryseotalea sanaruensis]
MVLLTGSNVLGQAAKSPYSTFGIGESYGNALAPNQGMGGLGFSQPQFLHLNNQNPALLVYNTLTVFQVGLVAEQLDLTDGVNNQSIRSGNLNYLAIAFPVLFRKITTSVGLMPYTNVDYSLQYDLQVFDNNNQLIDTTKVTEQGSGGLTQLYWSNGFRIYKGLSVGLKASYIFGSVNTLTLNEIQLDNQLVPFIPGVDESTYSKGFLLGGGISYSIDSLFNGNYRLNFGAVYDFNGRLNAERDVEYFRLNGSTLDTLDNDVLATRKGKLELPSGFGGGISFAKDAKWSFGIDYYYQDWSTFRSLNVVDDDLGQTWRWSLGGEFTPDYSSLNYFKRVTYRIGLSQAPFFANGKKVNDFGINFGLSLPTGQSSIDLAFKAGQRGSVQENGLKENYLKVYLGVTLNDRWFVKRKFD